MNTNKECLCWKPVFTIMINTGLRVGELKGLRWDDVDFENNIINVNHTLVYYNHRTNGCYFNINTSKTKSGYRMIQMIYEFRKVFIEEKLYQEESGVPQDIRIYGYTNFIFINRFGNVQNQVMLNKALRRIMRDCNDMILENTNSSEEAILLPGFSCHTLHHTFATRMCESGINIKVIQDILGHADITTIMNIYTDATKELKDVKFVKFNEFIKVGVA